MRNRGEGSAVPMASPAAFHFKAAVPLVHGLLGLRRQGA